MRGTRHHHGRDAAQPPNCLSRFVEPPHMRVAGREKTVGCRIGRTLLQRPEQHRFGVAQRATLRAKGEDELPVGAVVTVEPGVYVPGLGGVRIEDMVEVTEDGCRLMPRSTRDLVEL